MILRQASNLVIKNKIQLYWKNSIVSLIPYIVYNLIQNQAIINFTFLLFFNNITQKELYDSYNNLSFFYEPYNLKLLKKYYKNYLIYFKYFWSKITFRGKGFRLRKFLNSKKLTCNFGKSHWTKIIFNISMFRLNKIKRQSYILICCFKKEFINFIYVLKYIKLINHYTKRGLRIKRQQIKKRFGKISQMISSLQF